MCPSCHPANSVKALAGLSQQNYWSYIYTKQQKKQHKQQWANLQLWSKTQNWNCSQITEVEKLLSNTTDYFITETMFELGVSGKLEEWEWGNGLERSWMFVSGWLLDIIVMLRHTETIQFTEAIFGEWLRHIIQHLCTWTGNSRCSIVINTANAVGPSISDVWMKLTDSFKDVVASRSPSRMTPVVDVRRADHGIRSAGHQPRVGNADTRGQRRRKKRLEIAHETRRQAVQPAVAASQYNVRQQPIVKRRIKRRYHVCDDSRQIQTKVHVFCCLVQLVT